MNVVLVQCMLDPGSHAGNLQRLIRAVDFAADGDPSPDVVVLPGACDSGGALLRSPAEAVLQASRALLAWKAREWGVYLACGLHEPLGRRNLRYAALFDPDGDLLCRAPLRPIGETDELVMVRTPIGWLGVLGPRATGGATERRCVECDGGFVAVPVFPGHGNAPADATEERVDTVYAGVAGHERLEWGIVRAAHRPEDTGTTVTTVLVRTGGIVEASLPLGEEHVLRRAVSVPIPP